MTNHPKNHPAPAAASSPPATATAAPAAPETQTATPPPRTRTPKPPPARLSEIGAKRFLDELAEIGSVVEAAQRSRTPRASLYRRRDKDPAFAEAWDEAIQLAVERLQDEAMSRAIEGVEQPVFYRGVEVGSVRRTSDRLLMFLLRAHRREVYDPHYVPPWQPAENAGENAGEGAGKDDASLDSLIRSLGL